VYALPRFFSHRLFFDDGVVFILFFSLLHVIACKGTVPRLLILDLFDGWRWQFRRNRIARDAVLFGNISIFLFKQMESVFPIRPLSKRSPASPGRPRRWSATSTLQLINHERFIFTRRLIRTAVSPEGRLSFASPTGRSYDIERFFPFYV